MIFQFLSEDAIDPDFNTSLPAKRKEEIISGLQTALPTLLSFCFGWFSRIVQWQQERYPNTTSISSMLCFIPKLLYLVSSDSPLSLFSPALQMLSSLVLVAKADRLCEAAHDFSQVFYFQTLLTFSGGSLPLDHSLFS